MITLKVSFLLAIDLREEELKKPAKKRKGRKGRKPQKSVKSRKSRKSKQSKSSKKSKKKKKKKTKVVEEDDIYSVIEVRNPISYVHIEYSLFPKKFKYNVDVVCWGPVAKIYTKNGVKCLKTVITGDTAWVPVFIEHYLNPLSTEEIRRMLNQIISLRIQIGKNSCGAKAKSDKASVFYMYKDDDRDFVELYTQKPKSDSYEIAKKEIERILMKLLAFPINHEIVTWIYNINEVHAFKISKIISKRSRGEEVYCKDFYDEENEDFMEGKKSKKGGKGGKKGSSKKSSSKKSKSKKSSSSKRSRSKKGRRSKKGSRKTGKSSRTSGKKTIDLKIPAHVLLSDPALATYQVKDIGAKLSEIYILLSSVDILTLRQKKELCPLVVKIRKINDLPCDVLAQNGFQKVYSVCNIPQISTFRTSLRPISDTVRFDESRFIITSDIPKIKILELLETRRVIIKVIGVREIAAKKYLGQDESRGKKKRGKKGKKKKKSSKKSSKTSSNKSKSSGKSVDNKSGTETETLTLAVATFDLSSLATTFFLFKEKGQCRNLRSITEKPPPVQAFFIDKYTVNELSLIVLDENHTNMSPLTDPILLLNGTTVKFEAHFLTPVHPLFFIRDVDNVYKRLLLILFNEDVAKHLVSAILFYNEAYLGAGPFLVPNNFMIQRETATTDESVLAQRENMLSGFIIDDGNCFILYVEGHSNGYILSLVHQISTFNYSTGKVFYNSDYLFEERLYMAFHKYGGFFTVTLKDPLVDIFAQWKIYLEGNVPYYCLKAIQKLHLLFNSTTFQSILNQNVLPTEIELVSFSTEFGFQVRYSSEELEKRESGWGITSSHTDLFGHKV